MSMANYPYIPQGIIAGGGNITANGIYGNAPMGNVYNGVTIAGSSANRRQGLQPPPPPGVNVWTSEEHRIFVEGFQRYHRDPIFYIYAKIAGALPKKTIRDVALRYKWCVARKERSRRFRDGCRNSVVNSERKERIIYPSNSPALPMAHMSSDANDICRDNGDARKRLFVMNKDIFKKVSENPQAIENMELLNCTLKNIKEIMKINYAQEIANKMPPLPANLNGQLVQFIIQNSNPSYGAQLH